MKNFILLIFIVLAAFGCKPVAKILGVEKEDGADFSHYKTYNFYGVDAKGDTMPATFSRRVAILKRTIGNELNKRGFVQTTTNPDLLVNIGINIKAQVQSRETQLGIDGPVYIGQRNYSWKSKEIPVAYYKEGTVTLHFVDAKSNKMIWKGSVEGTVPRDAKTEESAKDGMALLFTNFPVAVK